MVMMLYTTITTSLIKHIQHQTSPGENLNLTVSLGNADSIIEGIWRIKTGWPETGHHTRFQDNAAGSNRSEQTLQAVVHIQLEPAVTSKKSVLPPKETLHRMPQAA